MNYFLKLALAALFVATSSVGYASNVDLQNSTFQWTGTKKVGSSHTGKVSLKSAEVSKKGEAVTGGKFVIDMDSISNEDIKGDKKNDFLGHIKSGDFFDVAKFPTATLVLDKVMGNKASGQLTVKGKTHSVEVPFEKKDNAYLGTLKFDRTKFDITYNSSNFFKNLVADRVINDEVTVEFKVVLK